MSSEDRAAIANLLERYAWTVDHGMWDEWVDCFAEDGVFVVRGMRHAGHEALRSFALAEIAPWQHVRHLLHHPSIEIERSSEATSRCYFELRGRSERGADFEALGSYEDRLQKTPQGWKLRQRTAHFDYFVRRGAAWDQRSDA